LDPTVNFSLIAVNCEVRATLVMPGLFAITFEGMHDLQMALFAAFGSFAALIMGTLNTPIQSNLLNMVPYVVTIVVLADLVRPRAEGVPYSKV